MTSEGPGRGGLLPTTPPHDAVLPERNPNAPAPGEPIPSHYTRCFVCGSEHEAGLRLSVVAGEGLTLTGRFTVTDTHQGAPGLAHGGLLTAAFDDALGSLNWLLTAPAVTGRLETDFRRPVPVGSTLFIRAEVVGVKGRKVFTRAVGRLDSEDGPVALTAAALFIQVPLEHFTTHGRPEDVERAREDRAVRRSVDNLEVNP
ncbi:MAG TPA: PaaI family thioesterase [Candidatus Nanopelagicales bacterium]|nr:PaaI family thioesterase [Candidatus Nanopelagicales bacterium]